MKKKYHTALLIGRFQPFHKGHLYLIYKALDIADQIIIGIGSTDKNDADNPFDIKLRKKMIRSVINHEKIGRNIKKVIEITDDPSDEKWFDETLKKSGYFDVVVGNNAWVNGIFDEAGYKIKRFRYYKRYFYEGEKIRKLMKEGQKWQNRLPRYLLLLIK